ncbi:MAG: hypothetical protein ACQEVA_21655 [Myxococcota bacterium]
MDPVIVLILTLLALSGGGAGSALLARRRRRRAEIRELSVRKVQHDDVELSIFDVFWDLGVSDYALEIMGHQGLLLEDPDDFDHVHLELEESIAAHGSYSAFLDDTLEAIHEFYEEHRSAGSRRKITTLKLRAQKLLPTEATPREVQGSTEMVPYQDKEDMLAAPGAAQSRELGAIEARRFYRETHSPHFLSTGADDADGGHRAVDVDRLTQLQPLEMLQGLFEGRLTENVQRWWSLRKLRQLKSQLDRHFRDLYDLYAANARQQSDFYDALYDVARRWDRERDRIRALSELEPWQDKPWAVCAGAVVEQSRRVATEIAARAKYNVDETIEEIHNFARRGDLAMAGYLLYLNHHAFFVGRVPEYGKYVERIERAAYRVQQELRDLKNRGELR